MAPLKLTRPQLTIKSRCAITTRSKTQPTSQQIDPTQTSKRKANSPAKSNALVKRSALVNISNAIKTNAIIVQQQQQQIQKTKKITIHAKELTSVKTAVVKVKKDAENQRPIEAPKKPTTRSQQHLRCAIPTQTTALKPKETVPKPTETKSKTRLSDEFNKTDESLYSSALENLCDSIKLTRSKRKAKSPEFKTPIEDPTIIIPPIETPLPIRNELLLNIGNHSVPVNVTDFDRENWNDIFQVSHYAMDIFNYMKSKEPEFEIRPYMDRQICLTPWMRSLLIDWMIEVQESFELNHETLYLGVKLVDLYLSKVLVSKETVQLVGAAAMFVASKYDERIPPLIDDFLYICDGAYSKREIIRMEMSLLKVCDFNLGIPISYRFLRRYARCAKVSMHVLTLARYVLEYSLMDYSIISIRDSHLAAAALYLALRMKNLSGWTPVLEFYTGYKLNEFIGVAITLNNGLNKKPREQLSTVRNKYSHKIFFEVAKTELIPNSRLLSE